MSVSDTTSGVFFYTAHYYKDEQEYGMVNDYKTYYDAFEAGLKEALKIVLKEKK